MEVVYFVNAKSNQNVSIENVFKPLMSEVSKDNNVSICYLPKARFNIVSIIKNLLFVYKNRTKCGINHVTGEVHYCILALLGCKTVLTVHDIGFITKESRYSTWKKKILYILNFYLPLKLSTKIISISDFTKNEILEFMPSVKHKLFSFPIATIDRFQYSYRKFDKDNLILLQNGVRPNKNLETTLKAIKDLPCFLRVVRKMSDEQCELAKKMGVKYENLYDLTDDEIVKTYEEADIILFPTLYEGFGVITIEAQAVGRPVITTNKEPMRSVAGGGAVLLNNPLDANEIRDAIMKVINDDDFREDLVAKGFENVKKYTLKSVYENHMNLYKSLINEL